MSNSTEVSDLIHILFANNSVSFMEKMGKKEFYTAFDVLKYFWFTILNLACRSENHILTMANQFAERNQKQPHQVWNCKQFSECLKLEHRVLFSDNKEFSGEKLIPHMFPQILSMRFDPEFKRLDMETETRYYPQLLRQFEQNYFEKNFDANKVDSRTRLPDKVEQFLWHSIGFMTATLFNNCYAFLLRAISFTLALDHRMLYWSSEKKFAVTGVFSIAGTTYANPESPGMPELSQRKMKIQYETFPEMEMVWIGLTVRGTNSPENIRETRVLYMTTVPLGEFPNPHKLFYILDPSEFFCSKNVKTKLLGSELETNRTTVDLIQHFISTIDRCEGKYRIDILQECVPIFARIQSLYECLENSTILIESIKRKTPQNPQFQKKLKNLDMSRKGALCTLTLLNFLDIKE